MEKQTILLTIMFLLILPVVIATPSFYVEQNKNYDLKISCFNPDNSFCTASTNCSITVSSPNNTAIINNQDMSFNTAFYNYTIASSNLTTIGVYPVIIQCTGTTGGFSPPFSFEVTMDGFERESNIALYISLTLIGLFFIFIGILTLWRGKDA